VGRTPPSLERSEPVVEEDPDDSVDIAGDSVTGDPEEIALALVKGQLGGTVIGELDQN
jgi:hypothetical protein